MDNKHYKTIINKIHKEKTNINELSKLIDKYLIPQELEKKTNAEVSTPLFFKERYVR